MKTRIHVNKQNIAQNVKDGGYRPAITAKTYKTNQYGHRVDVLDAEGNVVCSVVQADGDKIKPLSCGARVWIETNNEVSVTLHDEEVSA